MATPIDDALDVVISKLGGSKRDGQHDMANAVAKAMEKHDHLLVQAGTGTGKSLGYLVPAIVRASQGVSDDGDNRTIVATATLALQRQLIEEDLPAAIEALSDHVGTDVTYAVLKGRHNYVCLDKFNRDSNTADEEDMALFEVSTTKLGRQAKKLRAWVATTETGDRDDYTDDVDGRLWKSMTVSGRECIGAAKCAWGQDCFAEKARATAQGSDIVITNHALLVLDVIEGLPILPEHDTVVIDEAHELVDRTTNALAGSLDVRAVERAAGLARKYIGGATHDRLLEAADDLGRAFDSADTYGTVTRLEELTGSLHSAVSALRDVCKVANNEIGSSSTDEADVAAAKKRAKADISDLFNMSGNLLSADAYSVIWLDTTKTPILHYAPLSVATYLRDTLFGQTTVVMTSATLAVSGSMEAMAKQVGLTPDPRMDALKPTVDDVTDYDEVDVPSESSFIPKDEPGLDPWGLPAGGSSDAKDDSPSGKRTNKYASDRKGKAAGAAIDYTSLDVGSPFDYARQGILYCAAHLPAPTSSGVAEEVLDELAELIDAAGGRTLSLFSSWRGVERAAEYLALRFRGRDDRPIIVAQRGDSVADLVRKFKAEPRATLLGTVSLWQGIDVPGNTCTLVTIDRIPFPRPDDPVMSARSARVDAAGGSGFNSISIPKAALLLAQGVGRLIRTTEDRGVVAVLDSRLATKGYGTTLRKSLPPLWYTNDKASVYNSLRNLDDLASASENS